MKFIIQIFFFVTISLPAQNVETFFGVNFFGTNRIVFDNLFSSIPNLEQPTQYIRELEIMKFRLGSSFNLQFPLNSKKTIRIGLAYEWSGFGTKKYKPPIGTWNPVPSSSSRKDRYNIHQFSVPIDYINYLGDSHAFYWSLGFAIVVTPTFSRERVHIGNGDIVEGFLSSGEEFPKTNISLQIGFGWNKMVTNRIKLNIEPYIRYYLIPYDTYRESNSVNSFSDNYLGLSKSKGNMYNIGLRIFTQIKRKDSN